MSSRADASFGNIVKYIKMGASSNFGNMFSVLGASIFLRPRKWEIGNTCALCCSSGRSARSSIIRLISPCRLSSMPGQMRRYFKRVVRGTNPDPDADHSCHPHRSKAVYRELGQPAVDHFHDHHLCDRHCPAVFRVDADGDDHRDGDDASAARDLEIGGIDPKVWPLAFDGPGEKGLHLVGFPRTAWRPGFWRCRSYPSP